MNMDAPQTDVLSIEEIPVNEQEDHGSIALVTIQRPDKLNALNADVMASLKAMVAWVEATDSIRVVVLTGAQPNEPPEGKRAKPNAFVAGADITEFVGMKSDELRVKFTDNAVEALWDLTKPTIAMVDGFALGGGAELALSCDIIIASDRSKFGTPEINLGLIPGGGGTQRLCRLIGYGKALEMVLTGDMISSETALSCGLVNAVTTPDNLNSVTMSLAENIARKSPYTTKVAKRAVRASLDLPFTDGVLAERSEFVALFDTEDKEIGVQAFLDRSDAKWVGR